MKCSRIDVVYRHPKGEETVPFMSWQHRTTGWLAGEGGKRVIAYYVEGRGWYTERELENADPRSGPRF